MTLQNNDQFLVDRGNTPYSVDSQTLVAKLQDSDLMLVCRSGVPYKATGAEIKSSLGSPGVNPGLNDITLNPSTPGSGTEADPYILQTQVVAPYGSTTQSVETITIIGQPPEAQVVWKDSSVDAGSRFAQVTGELTDASGVWTGQLEYADIPDSTEDTTYVGKLSIGLVYFQWTITQKAVASSPTSVTNVSLIESDPEGDRFTSQSFVASSQVVDGEPISTKTFDAHVDGTLSKTVKFDEPLESSSSTTAPTYVLTGATDPENAFDGDLNTVAYSFATSGPLNFQVPDSGSYTPSDELVFYTRGGTAYIVVLYYTDGTDESISISNIGTDTSTPAVSGAKNWTNFSFRQDESTGAGGNTLLYGVAINGSLLVSDAQVTNLTFANGTDMEALAAGDTVNQTTNFTEPLESSSIGQINNYADGFTAAVDKEKAFDGLTDTYAYIALPTVLEWIASTPLDGTIDIYMPNGAGTRTYSVFHSGGAATQTDATEGWLNFGTRTNINRITCTGSGSSNPLLIAVRINGQILVDSGTLLTFANGTDMGALAAGDTVNQINNFTEPLESQGSSPGPVYSSYLTCPEGFQNNNGPDRAFDGATNEPPYSNSGAPGSESPRITWDCSSYGFTDTDTVELWFLNNGSWVEFIDTSGTVVGGPRGNVTGNSWWSPGAIPNLAAIRTYNKSNQAQGISSAWAAGVRVNGTILRDGQQPTVPTLIFANGTDMSVLAAGDDVSQPSGGGTQPDYLANGTWIYSQGTGSGDWGTLNTESAAFDGAVGSFPSGTGAAGNCPLEKTFSPAISGSTLVIKYPFPLTSTYSYSINGGSDVAFTPVTGTSASVAIPGGAMSSIKITQVVRNSSESPIWASLLEVDGMPLVSGGSIPVPTGTVGSITGTTATLSSSSGAWVNGEDVTAGNKTTTGTVGSIADTTATLSSSSGAWVNGVDVTTGDKTTTGTVSGVSDTTASLSSSSGSWVNGLDVVGPQKTIVVENARLYCAFDSNGNVTDLQNNPQDPSYTTQDSNPGLTFTFPATFPSGQTPDEELPDGTTFTVEVTAENSTSTSGPVSATVQPVPAAPVAPLAGLTTLYVGTSPNLTITNGIDNLNNGGLLWIKNRDNVRNNVLFDTERTANSTLVSNDPGARLLIDPPIVWNDNGFTLPHGDGDFNNSGFGNYVAWNFGKAAGYFDVVQWIGDGAAGGQIINHSLGTKPGLIVVKWFNDQQSWFVYSSSLPDANEKYLYLNFDGPVNNASANVWSATDSSFLASDSLGLNIQDGKYVAYLFAEDTPGVIKCGTFSGTGAVDVGFEPQWVLFKAADNTADWFIIDNKRGSMGPSYKAALYPNTDYSEGDGYDWQFTSTGWTQTSFGYPNQIYVAIAAPPLTRSQTNEEFVESQAKFLTYNNRAEIKAGQEAEAKREEVVQQAENLGINTAEIRKLLGK